MAEKCCVCGNPAMRKCTEAFGLSGPNADINCDNPLCDKCTCPKSRRHEPATFFVKIGSNPSTITRYAR